MPPRTKEYRQCCQSIVRNIRDSFVQEKINKKTCFGLTRVLDRVVKCSGLGRATVIKLLNEEVRESNEPEERNRLGEVTREDMLKIRPAVISMIKNKKLVTLNTLLLTLQETQEDDWKWEFGRTTLYKTLGILGFKFNSKRHNYYDRLRENEENVLLRAKYLKYFFNYIGERRPLVYMDESWINKNTVPGKGWHDGTTDTVDAIPPGKGARWILIGAGSKDGWISESFRMWKGNVQSEDYHHEMCSEIFLDWFQKYLLPNVEPNSVIVFDRATYHLELTDDSKGASSSMKKEDLATWLVQHNAKDPDDNHVYSYDELMQSRINLPNGVSRIKYSKDLLLQIAKKYKPAKKYKVFDVLQNWNNTKNTDIKINILPIAHPQLNPIELIWNWIKRYVAGENHDFNMETIRTLAKRRASELDSTYWDKSYQHSYKFAMDCWEADEERAAAMEQESDDILVQDEGNDDT